MKRLDVFLVGIISIKDGSIGYSYKILRLIFMLFSAFGVQYCIANVSCFMNIGWMCVIFCVKENFQFSSFLVFSC